MMCRVSSISSFKGNLFTRHYFLVEQSEIVKYHFGFKLMRQRDSICQFNGSVSTSEDKFLSRVCTPAAWLKLVDIKPCSFVQLENIFSFCFETGQPFFCTND